MLIKGFFPGSYEEYYPWGEFDGLTVEVTPETPPRLSAILQVLERQKAFSVKLSEPEPIRQDQLQSVHRPDYLNFLSKTSSKAKIFDIGMPSVFPIGSVHVSRDLLGFEGLLGTYFFDTSATIMENTYSAAMESAACALAAAKCAVKGDNLSLALCRPPGHHAGSAYGGGYCFLNNAAIASVYLQSVLGKVALVDIDFHHGNGSQDIFYETDQVLYVSIHGHPEDYFPYFWGFSSEKGHGPGKGFNFNFPLREGGSSTYLKTLETATEVVADFKPHALVLSAGFDTFHEDPIGDFRLHQKDFESIGRVISKLDRPTIIVLEGGYFIPELGNNFLALITGLIT